MGCITKLFKMAGAVCLAVVLMIAVFNFISYRQDAAKPQRQATVQNQTPYVVDDMTAEEQAEYNRKEQEQRDRDLAEAIAKNKARAEAGAKAAAKEAAWQAEVKATNEKLIKIKEERTTKVYTPNYDKMFTGDTTPISTAKQTGKRPLRINEVYTTKSGYPASVNEKLLDRAVKYYVARDMQAVHDMHPAVIILKGGIKVRLLKVKVFKDFVKLQMVGKDVVFWTHRGAIGA